jgi:phosphate starvation-inducible PhoH-like protein
LTRPIVTIEEDIGFLPGSIIKKMDPWTKPIFDIFLEHYSKSDIDYMLATCKIEICPLVFMRGRTFKNSFIIADEMQNSSPTQMKMLTTRIGDNSRMVITGDLKQTDILKENGLFDLITRLEKHNDTKIIKLIKFEDEDIERSEIVKEMIQIYSYNLNKTLNIENKTIENKTIENKTIENKTTNTDLVVSINNTISYNSNNDAALMPKHHMSDRYYDIFFKFTDF